MARSLGANGARQTRRAPAPRAAAWTAQDASRGAESPGHSTARQPAGGLARCQTVRRGALELFLYRWGRGGVRPGARSTVPTPTWPRSWADTSPSHAGLPTAPARLPLGPPPSTVRWSSGGRPPGPRSPGPAPPGPTRRTRCARSGRFDSDGPRATAASGAARAPPRAATARPTTGGLWSRPPPALDTSLPPPTAPGAL